MRFHIQAPEKTNFGNNGMALSPDGRKLAFIAVGSTGRSMLWVRPLDALAPQPLAGTEGTTSDILIHAKEFLRLKKDLNDILLKHTGQTLDRIEKDTDRDKFMSPQEAMEYGIVDKVLERLPPTLLQTKPES